jgi:regulator of replication initiation timing
MNGEQTSKTTGGLKQKLAQHLEAARGRLDALREDVANLHEEDMQALRLKRDEIRDRLDEQKERARRMQADIARWNAEKIAHTQEAIAGWRQRRQIDKLQVRAERAEEYALELVAIATLDFETAEQAVLEALAARFDAEAATAGSS